ncbi:RluA family pseudouridine synthase [Flavonifractor sp.]|uniref:RluA family pseudouridine synthase n=1 Tax=Flavonifractor sp. TaxID=2049025 RepID=UPI00307C1832
MQFTVERGGPLLPFLLEHVKGSRNHVKSLLARGQVQVDGAAVRRHDHPLAPGQRVSVLAQGAEARRAPFPVLYEDGRILVIDKPSGLLSMASDREKVRTAYRMAGEYVRRTRPGGRVFIVHRLDRDTSGVLLFAKDEEAKRAYQEHWDALVRRRGYLAVVEGRPPREEDTIRTLLRENAAHKVYSVRSGGKEAVTHYRTRPGGRVFIVHRLDRDTSGVLLFAKDEEAKRAYQEHWDALVRRRGYLAVVEGRPPREEDTIRTLLRENAAHKVYSVRSGGKEAVTHYRTIQAGREYTLLEVDIDTGRKNQIRAHLSELGCPVAGDRDYGAAASPLGRLCLHAHELALTDPFTGEERTFRSGAPRGFRALVC